MVAGFTGHNIVLGNGKQTVPMLTPVAHKGICRAALRDLALFVPAGATVADLGCYEGGYAVEFARAGYAVTGIEARDDNFACCQYLHGRVGDLACHIEFIHADVRDEVPRQRWDAVFCNGLLYHLDEPSKFLSQLGDATARLLILGTHYSVHPEAVHEGRRGHWVPDGPGPLGAYGNDRSFWLAKPDLVAAMRDAGFICVFEQFDHLADVRSRAYGNEDGYEWERGMFIGVKA